MCKVRVGWFFEEWDGDSGDTKGLEHGVKFL